MDKLQILKRVLEAIKEHQVFCINEALREIADQNTYVESTMQGITELQAWMEHLLEGSPSLETWLFNQGYKHPTGGTHEEVALHLDKVHATHVAWIQWMIAFWEDMPMPEQELAYLVDQWKEKVMKPPLAVELLKQTWLRERDWELEACIGFEAHRQELRRFRIIQEKIWAEEYEQHLQALATTLGVPGNIKLATYIEQLESRLAKAERGLGRVYQPIGMSHVQS